MRSVLGRTDWPALSDIVYSPLFRPRVVPTVIFLLRVPKLSVVSLLLVNNTSFWTALGRDPDISTAARAKEEECNVVPSHPSTPAQKEPGVRTTCSIGIGFASRVAA